ncbi:hypothetical protein [Streptomyces sp. 4F14]|uniref:hypothetical protein n=1 Tax=Streptomyces sp. 4F14 TaxID=3394380 RepID=UPI003A8BD901
MTERLFHFYVEGSEHGPYPGLADPRDTLGHIGPYCSPAFSRRTAEQIVAPDERGLYRIGGRWPWDYDGPLEAAERDQAALARSAARPATAPPPAAEPVPVVAAPPVATAPGR